MRKKTALSVMQRGTLGIPIGITIGTVISILVSFIWGQGSYSPCEPELVRTMGNEINAVILQTILCGLLGAAFGASSVIWGIDHWSLTKQTGIYFLIVTAAMFPMAYFMYWMEHSVKGFLSYAGIFVGLFILIWVFQYLIARNAVAKMNAKLN